MTSTTRLGSTRGHRVLVLNPLNLVIGPIPRGITLADLTMHSRLDWSRHWRVQLRGSRGSPSRRVSSGARFPPSFGFSGSRRLFQLSLQ